LNILDHKHKSTNGLIRLEMTESKKKLDPGVPAKASNSMFDF
jgi:hypothetical protein